MKTRLLRLARLFIHASHRISRHDQCPAADVAGEIRKDASRLDVERAPHFEYRPSLVTSREIMPRSGAMSKVAGSAIARSTFGTRVNAVPLSPNEPFQIVYGDHLWVGGAELQVLGHSIVQSSARRLGTMQQTYNMKGRPSSTPGSAPL